MDECFFLIQLYWMKWWNVLVGRSVRFIQEKNSWIEKTINLPHTTNFRLSPNKVLTLWQKLWTSFASKHLFKFQIFLLNASYLIILTFLAKIYTEKENTCENMKSGELSFIALAGIFLQFTDIFTYTMCNAQVYKYCLIGHEICSKKFSFYLQ